MSNRAYLYNTSVATSDPALLRQKLSEPGFDFAEVACGVYMLPIPWLCCFRLSDLQGFKYQMGDDEDVSVVDIALPVVSVQQALTNLRATLPLFISIAGDEKLGKAYWQEAVHFLESLPLPYLTIDPIEVMFMVEPDEFAQQLHDALTGDASAVQSLKELSGYIDGALPYPPDVLYAVPTNLNESRRVNTVALDIGGGGSFYWHLAKDSPQRPRESVEPLAPSGQPNLLSILEGMRKGIKMRKHNANVYFGFTSAEPKQRQQLKLLILTETDAERATLLADKTFMEVLFGLFHKDLHSVCSEHGFEWLGYVIASQTLITETLRKTLDDWPDLPVFERDGSSQPTRPSQQKPQAQTAPPSQASMEQPLFNADGLRDGDAASTPTEIDDPNIIIYDMPEAPGLFGKNTDGRIGRLRYIAFCVVSNALLVAAGLWAGLMQPISHGLAFLGLIPGVFALWLGIRTIVMRLHDVNLSGKWLLGLIFLPGLFASLHIAGGVVMGAALFWLALIVLAVWPGNSDANKYDAQSGPEPMWVRIVACAWLAMIPLAILGYNEQHRMANRLQPTVPPLAVVPPPPVILTPAIPVVPAAPAPDATVPDVATPSFAPMPAPIYTPKRDEDLPLPTHGGKVYGHKFLNYEIVVKGRVVTVYMTEQDHNYDLEGATGDISYYVRQPQMVRRVPLQAVGKNRMTATIPDDPFEKGDVFNIHISPQQQAGSSFKIKVGDDE
jgi:uncharacterized membrane protein YhaH (DUF805 family)